MALPNTAELARTLANLAPTAFEDFVAALLVAEHPGAVQKNPGGGGDGGIDVELATETGFVVWQVKAFHGPLNPSQTRQVKGSIARLAKHCETEALQLAEYVLVTAWTPNDAKRRTFFANVGVLACPAQWHGQAFIAGLIAKHPELYDLLLHGDAHMERFLHDRALLAGTSPGDPALPPFREAVAERQRALKDLEGLQTGPYIVRTTHLSVTDHASVEAVLPNLAGVMHRVRHLDGGTVEVQSAVPNQSHGDVEPIVLHTTVSKDELERNDAAFDWLYWGKAPAELEMDVQVEGGPFSDDEPVTVQAAFKGYGSVSPDAPAIVLSIDQGDGRDKLVMRLIPVEATRGPVGGGLRVVARSEGGAIEFEFRTGSGNAPETVRFALDVNGGQRPCDFLADLESLAQITPGDRVYFTIAGNRLGVGTDMNPPEAARRAIVIARALCEWSAVVPERLVMPVLHDIDEMDLGAIEDLRLAVRRESKAKPLRGMTLTVGDPREAARAFAAWPDGASLLFTRSAVIQIGNVTATLPWVYAQRFTGLIAPTPEELDGIAEGDVLQIRTTDDATVLCSIVVDDNGAPVSSLEQ